MKKFPHYPQPDAMDCGPTCLRMIAKHYGKSTGIQYLRELTFKDRSGVSLLGIADAAEKIGFRTMGVKITAQQLIEDAPLPAIVHWRQNHFVVVYKITKKRNFRLSSLSLRRDAGGEVNSGGEVIYVADPAAEGLLSYTTEEFKKYWISTEASGNDAGIALLLEPLPEFNKTETPNEKPAPRGLWYLLKYLSPYRKLIIQLFLGLLGGSLLSLILPFLTQSMVDVGINNQNLQFVYLVLGAQFMLFAGRTAIDLIRSWLLLHITARVNIALVSEFLAKMMRLPVSFFDTKNMGDILQRIRDNQRVKTFLTSSSLSFAFSLVNFVIFGVVLLIYSFKIMLLFLAGSGAYGLWVAWFLKQRRLLDYKRFNEMARYQSNEIQLIQSMTEIKLHNAEKRKRWEWEAIQIKLFKIDMSSLRLSQLQASGGSFINEAKNIVISLVAAIAVIKGEMTLGMMMAVTYILGQLNSPVLQFIDFMRESQDARISLERMGEIHEKPDEDSDLIDTGNDAFLVQENAALNIRNLCFRYGNPHSDYVLDTINLSIPANKTTAIVGASGSGKTTLLKLILKFYDPEKGEICLNDTPLNSINSRTWRDRCGVVMQDGFIFSDTIANNIAVGTDTIDKKRLFEAVRIANMKEYIEKLPLNYNTKIGQEGTGLSMGQKQRILIARAIYKNPDYLFFDEATSALDANNEREITEKISEFCKGRTTIVIAHRLSTVKNADFIVVLDKGSVAETGTHTELTEKRGLYYNLVKNQLELGS